MRARLQSKRGCTSRSSTSLLSQLRSEHPTKEDKQCALFLLIHI
jgi:hypothetical protein